MSIKVSDLKNKYENKEKKVKPLTTRILEFLDRHKGTAYTRREIARYLKVKDTAVSSRLGWLTKNEKIEYIKPYYYVEKKTDRKVTQGTSKTNNKKSRS